jgi:hypothetical protein
MWQNLIEEHQRFAHTLDALWSPLQRAGRLVGVRFATVDALDTDRLRLLCAAPRSAPPALLTALAALRAERVAQALAAGQLLKVDVQHAMSVLDERVAALLLLSPAGPPVPPRSAASADRVEAWAPAAADALAMALLGGPLADAPIGLLWAALHRIAGAAAAPATREGHQLRFEAGATLRHTLELLAAPHLRWGAESKTQDVMVLNLLAHRAGHPPSFLAPLAPMLGLLRAHRLTRSRRERAIQWVLDDGPAMQAGSDRLDAAPGADSGGRPRARLLWFRRSSAVRGDRRAPFADAEGGLTPAGKRTLAVRGSPVGDDQEALANHLLRQTHWSERHTRGRRSNHKWRRRTLVKARRRLRLPKASSPNRGPGASLTTQDQHKGAGAGTTTEPRGWAGVRALAARGQYRRWTVPKARGGHRLIEAPAGELHVAQRRAAYWLARTLPLTRQACAFAPGKNVVVHAAAHACATAAVQLDIARFFDSVRAKQLIAALTPGPGAPEGHPMRGWPPEAIESFVRLCVRERNGRWSLPQGAPTSPALSNAAAAPMDHRIRAAGNSAFGPGRWTYTRYADDLVISTALDLPAFAATAERIARDAISASGWRVNEEKVQRWHQHTGRPLVICGLLVGDHARPVALGREALRRSRAAMSTSLDLQLSRLGDHPARAPAPAAVDPEASAHARHTAEGVLSWAYTASGDLRWLAPSSGRVRELATSVHGSAEGHANDPTAVLGFDAFLLGWAGALAPRWATAYFTTVLSHGVSPT